MPGKTGATPRASRAIWRRSDISASPAPGYWTLTATSRSAPSSGGVVDPPAAVDLADRRGGGRRAVEPDQPLPPVVTEVGGELLAHGGGRHRGSGVLQRGEVLAVGRGQLLGKRRLQHAQRLAELHRAALELAERAEQLLGGALLDLDQHGVGVRPPRRLPKPMAGVRRTPGAAPRDVPCGRRPCGGARSWRHYPLPCQSEVRLRSRRRDLAHVASLSRATTSTSSGGPRAISSPCSPARRASSLPRRPSPPAAPPRRPARPRSRPTSPTSSPASWPASPARRP